METREVVQVRIYKLILNHVTDRYECISIEAISTDYDKLVNWYNSQKASEPWRDPNHYYKVFAEGTPLEWCNPADSLVLGECDHRGVGIQDEWINLDVYDRVASSGRYRVVD